MERLVVLDTETTGLDVDDGHKIIEIGCVEILGRTITSNSVSYTHLTLPTSDLV